MIDLIKPRDGHNCQNCGNSHNVYIIDAELNTLYLCVACLRELQNLLALNSEVNS